MAWPFSKKRTDETSTADQPTTDHPAAGIEGETPAAEAVEATQVGDFHADEQVAHDPVSGEMGPYDAGLVNPQEFDFSDFSDGVLNLGSLIVALPRPSEVQVEMGPQGPKMLHILTEHGRLTPVAFAASKTDGHWREHTKVVAEDMRAQNLHVTIEQGPWGREIVGKPEQEGAGIIRIIGVDGPRWMLRMTTAAPADKAEAMAELAREVVARTFVVRGNNPILAGNSLPVTLPEPLAKQVQQEMTRRAQQQNAQAQQNQQAQQEQQPNQE
ncbi:DUF3710 domain-containing protein [Corynebacterium kozikiae]|uniref:DUF3710 domain-containing protein n=1 Tax=Corynebacterium kozikiae TaxID=2968469 RepID=UPI00211D0FAE|nr:DUF3710 domain-containing protein [Corynebacterium sp. 76QC2CO]MCQ9342489.1 DUF3710 domain-containing protein [Corynebacterium sp. 76QC2CO]